MSRLTIYGTPASRTIRTIWMATELGLDYELDPVDFRKGETKEPAYLALNPNATVPTIEDGDFVLWESLAINLYLARKHPGPLTPNSLEEEMLAMQWSMWALTRLEEPCVVLVQNATGVHPHPADKVAAAMEAVKAPMAVLDGELADKEYLLGERFTVTDLNVSCVARVLKRVEFDFGAYPHVADWLDRCLARPACKEAQEIQAKAMAA